MVAKILPTANLIPRFFLTMKLYFQKLISFVQQRVLFLHAREGEKEVDATFEGDKGNGYTRLKVLQSSKERVVLVELLEVTNLHSRISHIFSQSIIHRYHCRSY